MTSRVFVLLLLRVLLLLTTAAAAPTTATLWYYYYYYVYYYYTYCYYTYYYYYLREVGERDVAVLTMKDVFAIVKGSSFSAMSPRPPRRKRTPETRIALHRSPPLASPPPFSS